MTLVFELWIFFLIKKLRKFEWKDVGDAIRGR